MVLVLLLYAGVGAPVDAGPVGESVAAGSVSFDRTVPGVLSIRQSTDRAIINWQDFSIGAGELTRFIQPGASAAALNRVLGGNPSAIYGTLQANGQIILLNPAGILVSAGGRVDTRGFIASTLNLSDESFLSRAKSSLGGRFKGREVEGGTKSFGGFTIEVNETVPPASTRAGTSQRDVPTRLRFSGDSGASVRNEGSIAGGDIYLIARSVDNSGTIRGGQVGLVGATEVVLGEAGQGVAVLYGQSGSVNNVGLIESATAELRAAGGNVYALAINNSGVVRAHTVANEGGKIVLKADGGIVASSGTLDASGSKGGEVQVLGARVGLTGDAVVDVSGGDGGGTVLIGGDFQGGAVPLTPGERTPRTSRAQGDSEPTPTPPMRGTVKAPLPGGEPATGADDEAPLLGGAGGGFMGSGNTSAVVDRPGAVDKLPARETVFPLPTGEGQGEGKGDVRSTETVFNAERTFVSKGATIRADALIVGDGGKVIVWSDDLTVFGGSIWAQGAPGGKGGFVEVSGKNTLAFDGRVSSGLGGSVLLDPRDITIQASGSSDSLLTDSQILFAEFTTGTDVTISAGAIAALTGDITLQAHQDLFINAPLILANQGVGEAVTFLAGRNISITAAVNTSGASLSFSASDAVGVNDPTATLTIAAPVGNGKTGNITFNNDGSGAVQLGNLVTSSADITFNDSVVVTVQSVISAANVTFNGTVNADASVNDRRLTVNANGVTTFNAQVGNTAPLSALTTDGIGTVVIGPVGTTGTNLVNATTQLLNDPVTLSASTVFSSSSGSGLISFGSSINGAKALVVNTPGTTRFGGSIGNSTPLTSVTTDASGTTILKGGTIQTTGAQTYNDAVVLGADTVLAAQTLTFNGTVNADLAGNNRVLTLNVSGTNTLSGVIGGGQRLGFFATDSAGQTVINTSAITAKSQTYNDSVKVSQNTTLTATAVSFNGTVNAATPNGQTLSINADGATAFNGVVGGSAPLGAITTDASGTTTINGLRVGAVTTNLVAAATQTYNDPLTLGANTIISGAAVTFANTLNGDAVDERTLTVNGSGITTFSSVIGGSAILKALTTDALGSTTIAGGAVSATTQTYNDAVTLTVDTVLRGASVTLAGTLNGNTANLRTLSINANGTTTISGVVGGSAKLLNFSTDAPGTTALNNSVTATTLRFRDAVVLGGSPTLTGTDVTFDRTVNADLASNSRSLTVTASNATTFNAPVGGTQRLGSLTTDIAGITVLNGGSIMAASQTYNDPVTLGLNTTLTSTALGPITFGSTVNGAGNLTVNTGGAVTFGGVVGGATALTALTTDAPGTLLINTTDVTTTGGQTYNDGITLGGAGAAISFRSTGNGAITFGSTLSGSKALSVHTAGVTRFGGSVTSLTSLTTDALSSTIISAASVSTTGSQTYNGPLTLGANTALSSLSAGNIEFISPVNGAFGLIVNTAGTTTFGAAVGSAAPLASVTTDNGAGADTTVFNAGIVRTTGIQAYGDDVLLGATTTLTSTASGNITLGSTVNGAQSLTINTSGTTAFSGRVGSNAALVSLTTDAGGTVAINGGTTGGGTVITTGAQTYNDAATLAAATILQSTGNGAVTFGSSLNGAQALTINSGGLTTFRGNVGGTIALSSLTTDAGGSTALNGGGVAAATQTYNDPLTLGVNTTLTGTTVTFANTVDADLAANKRNLTINATTTLLAGIVGGVAPLFNLLTDAGTGGSTTVNTSAIAAVNQTYNDAFVVGVSTTLTATTVTFGSTVNGALANAQSLTVNASGSTAFNGVVGGTAALVSLTTDLPGTTTIKGSVTTGEAQTYNDSLILATNATFAGSSVTFAGTVDADLLGVNRALTVNTSGPTTFAGKVGASQPLGTISTDAGGALIINSAAMIATTQNYADPIALGADTALVGTTITLASVTGGGFDLALNAAGATTLNGGVAGVKNLSSGNGGTTFVNTPFISTTGKQTFSDSVTLGTSATFASSGIGSDGDVTFSSAVNGAQVLVINTAGTSSFRGVVGGTTAPVSLTTDAGGGTVLAGSITTSGAQSYGDTVTLGGNTTLTGTVPTFNSLNSVTGAGFDLILNYSSDHTIDGAKFTGIRHLTTGNGGTVFLQGTGAGSISTTGPQTFNDAVTLVGHTTLVGSDLTFVSTVAGGGFNLTLTGGGSTTLSAAVSGVGALNIDGGGSTIVTADVTTDGSQTYGDLLVLAGTTASPRTFTAGVGATITVGLVVGGGRDMTLSGPTTVLAGPVTGVKNLAIGGATSIHLNGSSVTTTGTQTYNNAVVLGANVALRTTGSGTARNITLVSTVDADVAANNRTLSISTPGTTTFGGAVGSGQALASLTTDSAGTTAINGGLMRTSGAQTYNDAVTLGAGATLTSVGSGNIAFVSTVNGAQDLIVNTSGTGTFGAAVGGTTPLASLATDATGGTTINGGNITTTGTQTYGDTLTLGANTTFAGTTPAFAPVALAGGGFDLALNFSGITTLNGTFSGIKNLSTGNGGATTLTDVISTSGTQAYSDPITLLGATTLTSTGSGSAANIALLNTVDGGQILAVNSPGTTIFAGQVGNSAALTSLVTDAAGTSAISGVSVRTSGGQTYNDSVTLGAATTLTSTSSGNIALIGAVNGAFGLAVNTGGVTTFAGVVGGTLALTSIATDATGGTILSGGSIVTSGAQSYGDTITLGANMTLTGTNPAFASPAVTGAQYDLTLNFSGTTALDGTFSGIKNLSMGNGGATTLSGAIGTSGTQTYNDVVTLAGPTTLTSAAAGSSGNVAFSNTVNGPDTLTINTAGTTSFSAPVGNTTPLASLSTDAGGIVIVSGGLIKTTGSQTYNDGMTMGAVMIFSSIGTGNIGLLGTVNGAFALTVNTAGATTFGSAVGGTAALSSLTTDSGGGTTISGGSITTTGNQTYGDAVTISTTAVTLTGAVSSFASLAGGGQNVTLNFSGTTVLDGANLTGIANLTTANGGTTSLTGALSTSGSQTYNDAVSLAGASTLTSSGNQNITFASTVNGGQALAVNTGGTTTFSAVVGGTAPLTSLTTGLGGATAVNTVAITTTGDQVYNGALTLGASVVMASSAGGNITFSSTVNGARTLTVNTGGTTTFAGAVGGGTALTSLITNSGGGTTISGGGVTTTGNQTYGDVVTISTVPATLTGATPSFTSLVGGGQNVTLNFSGTTAINGGSFTGIANLMTGNGGTTTLIGAVTTIGSQTYNDAVSLVGATTLTSLGDQGISFSSTVNGAQTLIVNTGGMTRFSGVIGGTAALTSLISNAGGTTAINTTGLTTTGAQTYNDPVTLGANVTLISSGSGSINLASTVDGAQSLTVNTTGTTTFGGAVGGTIALNSITTNVGGTTAITGGAIRTSGNQTYGDTVTISLLPVTLTGDNSSFVSLAGGGQNVTLNFFGISAISGATFTGIANLMTGNGGTTTLTGAITTSGSQTYSDPISLAGATTLTSSGNQNISLASTVNGAQTLTINTVGTTSLGGTVGGTTPLASLITNAGGGTTISGGTVTTAGAQTYGDTVTLGADAALTGTVPTFAASAVTGASFDLTLNFSGTTILNGTFTGIKNLTTGNGGGTTLSGSISTTGTQTYHDAISLGGATTLASTGSGNASNISFNSTVNGAQALIVGTAGTFAIGKPIGATTSLASLMTDSGGVTVFGSATSGAITVKTSGPQNYQDNINLGADTTLTSSGVGRSGTTTLNGFSLTISP